jgi:uncharacterized protein YqgV (UPF0045/DUF77 family)
MEAVVDFEYLPGVNNDTVIKEVSIAAENIIQTYHFEAPYPMHPNGSVANGINWDDGYIPYSKLENVLKEAVAAFPHLYAYGTWKCKFLEGLTGRTFISLEDFECPAAEKHKHKYNCGLSCHKFPNVNCATRHAFSYYKWLLYHFQTKSYVRCPPEMTRHTAKFVSAV